MQNRLLGTTLICGLSAITSLACGGGSVADTPQAAMIEMVKIPGGAFIMGSPETEPEREEDEIQHTVTVDSFYMGKYQVTQEQYEAVRGPNPSYFDGANLPSQQVTWYDAVEFCNKLSKREGLEPVYTITGMEDWDDHIEEATVKADWSRNGYRLPTEAEWEYACRAGTTTPFNTGNSITPNQANYNNRNKPYNNNVKRKKRERTTPAGCFAPNTWGLYDMHGNVLEWCWDWYGDYSTQAQANPKGPEDGASRVLRGGSWKHGGKGLRSACRNRERPDNWYGPYGFRVARN